MSCRPCYLHIERTKVCDMWLSCADCKWLLEERFTSKSSRHCIFSLSQGSSFPFSELQCDLLRCRDTAAAHLRYQIELKGSLMFKAEAIQMRWGFLFSFSSTHTICRFSFGRNDSRRNVFLCCILTLLFLSKFGRTPRFLLFIWPLTIELDFFYF